MAHVNQGGLMTIGALASKNIAAAINASQDFAPCIERAIKDEITALSSHFSLALADVQTTHEVNEATLKKDYDARVAVIESTYRYVKAHKPEVFGALFIAFVLGAIVAYLV